MNARSDSVPTFPDHVSLYKSLNFSQLYYSCFTYEGIRPQGWVTEEVSHGWQEAAHIINVGDHT